MERLFGRDRETTAGSELPQTDWVGSPGSTPVAAKAFMKFSVHRGHPCFRMLRTPWRGVGVRWEQETMAENDPLGLVGTTVADKYVVERVVGEGGFAIVYRAMHTLWQRPVALKVFKSLTDVPETQRQRMLEEFIQEGALLADLSARSAAIVQARDIGTLALASGQWVPYMVLEWLEGQSLEDVLAQEKQRGLPLRSAEETVRLLEPVAQALSLAHSKGVAHRDVKPANLYILDDPRGPHCSMKLLDFGIAKVVQDAQQQAGAFQKTGGAITAFTPVYGAPEQFTRSHGATGPWTDVFALALVAVELMTGREALEGDDLVQLAVASGHPTDRPTPRRRGATVTDAVEAVFSKALAVKPAERYSSAGEFWAELREALGLPSAQGSVARIGGPGSRGANLADERAVASGARAATQGGLSSSSTVPAATVSGKAVLAFMAITTLGIASGVAYFALHGQKEGTQGKASRSSASGADAVSQPAASLPSKALGASSPPSCPPAMVFVPGGTFRMGTDSKEGTESERPVHEVTVNGFCMDTTEVTVAAYKACSDGGECKRAGLRNEWDGITDDERKREERVHDSFCNIKDPSARAEHPINCVDWALASAYCTKQKKRLPTEAEWEFAARGSDGRTFPWGSQDPTAESIHGCGVECMKWAEKAEEPVKPLFPGPGGAVGTAPVGSHGKGATPTGLQDLSGNVAEWVQDFYGEYPSGPQTNPEGPSDGRARVVRGGSWMGPVSKLRGSARDHAAVSRRSHLIGFRCAKTP